MKQLLLLASTLFVLGVAWVASEWLLERYYYGQTYRYYETAQVYYEEQNTPLLFRPDRRLFWTIKPDIELQIEEDPIEYGLRIPQGRRGHYAFSVRSNSAGLNSPEIARTKPPETLRIVTLGDSRTMAEGVPFDDLYPRRLEALLSVSDPTRSYQVINGGVSGYSSHQGLVQLEQLLANAPDFVTVLFGINDQDLDQGISDREKEAVFDSWRISLASWSNQSLLVYFVRRQALSLKGLLFGKTPRESVVYREGEGRVRRVSPKEYEENLNTIANLGQEHGFQPVFLIVPTSPYAYYPYLFSHSLPADVGQKERQAFYQGRKAFKARQFEQAVSKFEQCLAGAPNLSPARHMLGIALQHLGRFDEAYRHFLRLNEAIIFTQYEAVVRRVAKQRGVPLVDLTSEFVAPDAPMVFVDDMHPSVVGHQMIARRLAEVFGPLVARNGLGSSR